MILQPRNPDITFLDLVTMKPRCTFNQCRDKFEPCASTVSNKPMPRGRPMVTKPIPIYACRDCGRKVQETAADAAADAAANAVSAG
jgi:hypothetical protein